MDFKDYAVKICIFQFSYPFILCAVAVYPCLGKNSKLQKSWHAEYPWNTVSALSKYRTNAKFMTWTLVALSVSKSKNIIFSLEGLAGTGQR